MLGKSNNAIGCSTFSFGLCLLIIVWTLDVSFVGDICKRKVVCVCMSGGGGRRMAFSFARVIYVHVMKPSSNTTFFSYA